MGCASSKEAEVDKAQVEASSVGGHGAKVATSCSATSGRTVPEAGSPQKAGLAADSTNGDAEKRQIVEEALSSKSRNGAVGPEQVVLEGIPTPSPSALAATRRPSDDTGAQMAPLADLSSRSMETAKNSVRLRTHRVSRSSHCSVPLPQEFSQGIAGATHPGIGRAGVNQDAYTTHVFRDAEGQVVWLSAVFDGHGPDGEKVAKTAAGRMREHFEEQSSTQLQLGTLKSGQGSMGNVHVQRANRIGGSLAYYGPGSQRVAALGTGGSGDLRRLRQADKRIFRDAEERVLHMTFQAMEDEVQEECNAFLSGSTCSTCLVKKGIAWLAAVGDSSSLLLSRSATGATTTTVVGPDHRLTNEDELRRVIAAGARVAKRPNQKVKGHLRIWLQEADSPGLMVTRSLGDAVGKSIGVTCEPDVTRIQIAENDKFIVMASDGVWDAVSNETVAETVMAADTPEDAAQEIVNKSLDAWKEKRDAFKAKYGRAPGGIGDNITAVVVSLELWRAADDKGDHAVAD
eukprot:jgi/Tetstr1/429035/TSEL_019000.t1